MDNRDITPARVRGILARGVVATTALAAVVGVVAPTTALAAPSNSAAAASTIGTDESQRVSAAAVVGLDATWDVLQRSDLDFLQELWRKAREGGERYEAVRMAAEEAMLSAAPEDHVRFIVTGIHEAYETDKKREQEREAAARAQRLAKSQALIAVGIPSSPDLLALSDDNFVRAVMKHEAAGPEVKTAAAAALAGDASAWREFITNGAREAHQRDVTEEVRQLQEKNREEAQRRQELAARKSAAALFNIVPSDAMLSLSDDNFIRELLRQAVAANGPELYAAAQKAALSSAPADWREFIHTGAEKAYKADAEKRRRQVAEANRLQLKQLTALLNKTGVNPWFVAKANKALVGTDEDVVAFLKSENQYRAMRQSLQPASGKPAGFFLRQSRVDANEAFVAPVAGASKQTDREDATWIVVPSLAKKADCYSFESARDRGSYLTLKGLRVVAAPHDGSDASAQDATWCARPGLSGSGKSFESASQPKRWLRQFAGDVLAAAKDGKNRFDGGKTFEQDVTWKLADPLAP
ncbi:AbfB domain-containing protein [Streptomyces xanthochromogenes]|uniref:AbfB domain-containing protein n=1 Tax=Streptomyces xanthochromogenes TaxID=67384 RepID=UPI002F404D00